MFRLVGRLAAGRAAAATLQHARGLAGKVIAKAGWEGWPRRAPDGWPYARYLKYKHRRAKTPYVSKQEMARRDGTSKELTSLGPKVRSRMLAQPEFEIMHAEAQAAPVVLGGGLRRRLMHAWARAPPRP